MLEGAGGPRQLQRARGVWDQPGPSGVCVSMQRAATGDKGQAGATAVCCVCPSSLSLAAGWTWCPGAAVGTSLLSPAAAPDPSWVGSDPTDHRARSAHPLCRHRSLSPAPRSWQARLPRGARQSSSPASPFPRPCVITGSGSEFIQLLARVSSAPSDAAAVARLTALGHAPGGPR